MNAIAKAGPGIRTEFYEREIIARLENGGSLEIVSRGNDLRGVQEVILSLLPHLHFNRDQTIDFHLTYWHLTEDLATVEISIHETDSFSGGSIKDDLKRILSMMKLAQTRFLADLATHSITLNGPKGSL